MLRGRFDVGWYLTAGAGKFFMEIVASRYYNETSHALRSADDSSHPIMSARFPILGADNSQAPFYEIAAEFCDVLCFNLYTEADQIGNEIEKLGDIYAALQTKRPFLITEFTFHADKSHGWDGCWGTDNNTPDPGCERHGGIPWKPHEYPDVNQPQGHHNAKRGVKYGEYVGGLYSEGYATFGGASSSWREYIVIGHLWHTLVDHPIEPNALEEPVVSSDTQNWGMMRGIDDANEFASWDWYTPLTVRVEAANRDVQCQLLGTQWGPIPGDCNN